jgi:NADH-quinone oxidoreductase subunit L
MAPLVVCHAVAVVVVRIGRYLVSGLGVEPLELGLRAGVEIGSTGLPEHGSEDGVGVVLLGEVGPFHLSVEDHEPLLDRSLGVVAVQLEELCQVDAETMLAAYYLYVKRLGTAAMAAGKLPRPYSLLAHKYYVDEIYGALIVRPGKRLAAVLWKWMDVRLIDGAVNNVARGVIFGSRRLQRVQTGFVRNYALAMLCGAIGVIAYLSVR